ncbi:MAG: hypothetical protein HPZ91_16245 [Lentisphaeria bacterium]|nr:hypothetical protein [Lentisphaeria bacterium]
MAKKDSVLLFIPALIGGIIVFSIFLLDIQLANFQEAYFREVADETKRNNYFLVRFCKEQLEANDLDKLRRLFRSSGPNPMVARIIARGKGGVVETENAPEYLLEHIRSPEVRGMFKENKREDVLVKYDEALKSFMVYHSARFNVDGQDYILVMASKCNSMTMLMRQTRQDMIVLTILGILSTVVLIIYFSYLVRSPLNRLFASMSKIAAGELEYPVYVPRYGLVHEIAICLQSLTEQLKKQIATLRDEATEREIILNSLTEALLLVNATGRVERCNRTACELFYPGMDPDAPEMPECPGELKAYIRNVGDSGIRSEELCVKRGEKELRLLANAVSFTRDGGRYVLVSITDLTDIRKLEAYRTEFIAAISHEMKTPLTGIVGAVDAINNGALENEEYKARCIQTLTLQSERLHALLQNFLTLNSLEYMPKGAENDFLPVQPQAVVRSAMEVCKPEAEASGIELAAGECCSCEFPGDALLLQQALNNLISNAIHHSETKRIEISAAVTPDRHIDFRVRDYGCGIAPEHIDRIFKRFYRIPTNRGPQKGNGIGLAIVKHVALYHNGSVSVASRPGEGSCFHLLIPLTT